MDGRYRVNVTPNLPVAIILKEHQRTKKETLGTVATILTNSAFHPHGIKVRLTDGQVGRIARIIES